MNRKKVGKYFLTSTFLLLIAIMFSSFSWAKTTAISLGTSRFKSKRTSDLPACEDDAEHMADVLYEQGVIDERVEPLTGPNRKKIIEYKIKREIKSLEKGDTLIIFNSSHGSKEKGIVTFDGYISDEELSQWLSESECSRILLINDSCFSGKFELNLPDKEVCQINSSSAPMVSFVSAVDTFGYWNARNSVFTKYVIEAMRPANSDKNGDGNVTAGEIRDYVKNKILNEEAEAWRKTEDPAYATLEDAKNAMDKALEDWKDAKRRGDATAMDTFGDEYWRARRAYEDKVLRVEMRWQSPTITGDSDFIVVGKGSEWLYGTTWLGKYFFKNMPKTFFATFLLRTSKDKSKPLVAVMDEPASNSSEKFSADSFNIDGKGRRKGTERINFVKYPKRSMMNWNYTPKKKGAKWVVYFDGDFINGHERVEGRWSVREEGIITERMGTFYMERKE